MFNDQMIKRHHFCYGCQQSCSTAARNAGQVKRKAALATIPIRLVGGRIEPTLADLAQESAVFPSFRVRALKASEEQLFQLFGIGRSAASTEMCGKRIRVARNGINGGVVSS
jgi:hypothetical protein